MGERSTSLRLLDPAHIFPSLGLTVAMAPLFRFCSLILVLLGPLLASGATRGKAPAIEAFFGEGPLATAISPSGEWLAFSAFENGRCHLYTRSIKKNVGQKLDVGGLVDELVFVNDAQVVCRRVIDGEETLALVNFERGDILIFTPRTDAKVSIVARQPPSWRSGKLYFNMAYEPDGLPGMRSIVVPSSGLVTDFQHARASGIHPTIRERIFDPSGKVVALVLNAGAENSLAIESTSASDEHSWNIIHTANIDEFPLFLAFGAPPGKLRASGYFKGNFSSDVLFDPATRVFGEQLLGAKDANIRSVTFSPDRTRVDSHITWAQPAREIPLTDEFRGAAAIIDQVIGKREWAVIDLSRDYAGALVVQTSDSVPPRYWHIDLREKRGFLFFDTAQQLASRTFPEMELLDLTARDALILPCYRLESAGVSASAPLVLFVGGGPFEGVHREWSPMMQAIAANGAVVIAMNYRGSRGFGRNFFDAGRGQGDAAMIDDVEDVLQQLRNSRQDKRRKLVVVASSFGGFLSIRALARGNISVDGLVTINPLLDATEFLERMGREAGSPALTAFHRERFFGSGSSQDRSVLQSGSQLSVPQLVIQSNRDERVPPALAREYVRDTNLAGGKAEWVELDDAHDLKRVESHRLAAVKIAEFLRSLKTR